MIALVRPMTRCLIFVSCLLALSPTLAQKPHPPAQHRRPKALVVYSPHIPYSYDMRAQHKNGSGVFILEVDEATGSVSQVTIQKSTGVQELDDYAVDTF